MIDMGNSDFSSISAVAGTRGRDSRANLGDELPWSKALKAVCEVGGNARLYVM
jgi:hypothetical protein